MSHDCQEVAGLLTSICGLQLVEQAEVPLSQHSGKQMKHGSASEPQKCAAFQHLPPKITSHCYACAIMLDV